MMRAVGRGARWRRWSLPLRLVALAVASAGAGTESDASPETVLGRFVGVSKTEALVWNAGNPSLSERRTSGGAAGRLVLDGRYVEFRTSSIDPPGLAELQLMTYDPGAGLYRQWVSDSENYRREAVGRWDAATSTLRWEGRVDGATFVIDDRWISPDRLEWTLTRTSADGRILQTIQGVVSR